MTKGGIKTYKLVKEIQKGWIGQPKGMLQVLWERGFINTKKLSLYTEKGKQDHKDSEGKLYPEYKQFSLTHLMHECDDFVHEPSAMEKMMNDLCTKKQDLPNLKLFLTPKYHCEMAGEGVEYDWAICKKHYRNIPLPAKVTKENFHNCVRSAIKSVTIHNTRKFSAKSRWYMITYSNIKDELTYSNIENFVKKIKTHRDVSKIDTSYIDEVWKKSIGVKIEDEST